MIGGQEALKCHGALGNRMLARDADIGFVEKRF
jgi:hypothetical protein